MGRPIPQVGRRKRRRKFVENCLNGRPFLNRWDRRSVIQDLDSEDAVRRSENSGGPRVRSLKLQSTSDFQGKRHFLTLSIVGGILEDGVLQVGLIVIRVLPEHPPSPMPSSSCAPLPSAAVKKSRRRCSVCCYGYRLPEAIGVALPSRTPSPKLSSAIAPLLSSPPTDRESGGGHFPVCGDAVVPDVGDER